MKKISSTNVSKVHTADTQNRCKIRHFMSTHKHVSF